MSDDETAVRQAVEMFYQALNAMLVGDPNPLSEVYSHADDVTYMGAAGGTCVGWDQVFADWSSQAAMIHGGNAECSNVRVTVGQDMAVAASSTKGQAKDKDGNLTETVLRETSVFRKEDGQWKMINHHADPLAVLLESRAALES